MEIEVCTDIIHENKNKINEIMPIEVFRKKDDTLKRLKSFVTAPLKLTQRYMFINGKTTDEHI